MTGERGAAEEKPILICRNVSVNGRRTSLRMEPMLWDALCDICDREGRTLNEICSRIDERRAGANLTASVRVFIISYLRAAARRAGGLEDAGEGPSLNFHRALDDAVPLTD